jgi:hypothetical protein
MFQAGLPEKIFQERTGHRSVQAHHIYERTTTTQHMAVSSILSTPKEDTSFSSLVSGGPDMEPASG